MGISEEYETFIQLYKQMTSFFFIQDQPQSESDWFLRIVLLEVTERRHLFDVNATNIEEIY